MTSQETVEVISPILLCKEGLTFYTSLMLIIFSFCILIFDYGNKQSTGSVEFR
jgi:hypothetical protein